MKRERDDETDRRLTVIEKRLVERTATTFDIGYIAGCARFIGPREIVDYSYSPVDTEAGEVLLRRTFVEARARYICHMTNLPIEVGEDHVSIVSKFEGQVRTTRHSLVAVFCIIGMERPDLLEEIASVVWSESQFRPLGLAHRLQGNPSEAEEAS